MAKKAFVFVLTLVLALALLAPGFADATIIENFAPAGASERITDSPGVNPPWLNQTFTAAADERVCNISYVTSATTGANYPTSKMKIEIINSSGTQGATNFTILWDADATERNASLTSCINLRNGGSYKIVFTINQSKYFGLMAQSPNPYGGGSLTRYDNQWDASTPVSANIKLWNDQATGPDTIAPSVSVSFPQNNSFLNPSISNLSVFSSDNSGVANVTIYGNWSTSDCYQESTNITDQGGNDGSCGLSYNGSYSFNPSAASFNNPAFLVDGDNNSISLFTGAAPYFDIVYYKPASLVSSAVWTTYFNSSNLATTASALNFSCFQEANVTLRINKTAANNQKDWWCWTGAYWEHLGGPYFFSQSVREEHITWVVGAEPIQTVYSPANNTNSSFRVFGLENGAYSWYAVACDNANNCSATGNYTFFVDNSGPILSNFTTSPNQTLIQQGSPISFNLTVNDVNLTSLIFSFGNGTNYSLSTNGSGNYALQFGEIQPIAYNYTWFATDGAGMVASSPVFYILGFIPYLGGCGTLANTTVLNFSFFDEESLLSANATVEWNGTITSVGLSVGTNGTNTSYSVPFCFYPSIGNFTANLLLNYYNASSSQRQYYVVQLNLNNASQNDIPLYLLNSGETANITVKVMDGGLEIPAFVQFQRYYTSTNQYRAVSMVKTAEGLGGALAKLRPYDVWYRVVVISPETGNAIKVFEPVRITTTDLIFDVSSGTALDYWNYAGKVSGSCQFANSSGTISCTVVNGEGLATASAFTVTKEGPLADIPVCSQSSTTAGTTYLCNVGNSTGNTYGYTLSATVQGKTVTINAGSITGQQTGNFGNVGLLLTVFVIVGVAAMGAINPAVMVVLAILGIFVSQISGLALITRTALISLAAVGGILIYRMRT